MIRNLLRGPVALLVALMLLGACTQVRNPATGEVQFTSLTPEEETALGREEHPKVKAQFGGDYNDPLLAKYVEGIGERLKAQSELPDVDFTFTVLDSPVVNAFALPGGFVYISRGLLALAENEAEVAGVLGHEIGHVTARHTAQRYDRAVAGQVGSQIAGIAGAILGGYLGGSAGARAGGQLAGQAAGLGAQAWVQGFSREQEFQADELGVRYLTRTNYDPRGMSTFLGALQANDEYQRKVSGSAGGDSIPNWLRSHPRTAERVERAAEEAAVSLSSGGKINRDQLLNAINGMVYGDSPAQGLILGQRFAHPDLRFAFTVPDAMSLRNAPNHVSAYEDRAERVRFSIGESASTDFEAYVQDKMTPKFALKDVQAINAAGRRGAIGFAQGKRGNVDIEVMIAALDGPGSRVYEFIFASRGNMTAADRAAYNSVMDSLEDLSEREAALIKPLRIRLVDVQAGQRVDDFVRMMEVNEFAQDLFITLNGLNRGRQLRAGDRVKIIVRG